MAGLETGGMTTANRIACWIVFLVSLMLICDLGWNLSTGGHFQLLRHTTGMLGMGWVLLFWWRATALARQRLADELRALAESDPELAKSLAGLEIGRLAWAEVLLGLRLRNRLLRRQVSQLRSGKGTGA